MDSKSILFPSQASAWRSNWLKIWSFCNTPNCHLFECFFFFLFYFCSLYLSLSPQEKNPKTIPAKVMVTLPFAFRYYYKFIVNGQWKHSTASPSERDESGNVNNIIVIGETASVRPSVQHQQKVCSQSIFAFLHFDPI